MNYNFKDIIKSFIYKKNYYYIDYFFSQINSIFKYPVRQVNSSEQIERNLFSASWLHDSIPGEQRKVVERQLYAYREGNSIKSWDILVKLLKRVPNINNMSLLEIGCSSGYFSEVFNIKGVNCKYSGCDISESFIELANKLYPDKRFDIEDATMLTYSSNSLDIVLSGNCLLHIEKYKKAIKEAFRVLSQLVIFHNTPVIHIYPTAIYWKKAYRVEMFEYHFNESEFIRDCVSEGGQLIDIATIAFANEPKNNEMLSRKTYVFRKINP